MGVLPSGDEPASSGRAARSPRRYDDSFRRYAVKRAAEPDARVADVAEELGVSASTLRRWVKAAGAGEAAGGAGAGGSDGVDATVSSGASGAGGVEAGVSSAGEGAAGSAGASGDVEGSDDALAAESQVLESPVESAVAAAPAVEARSESAVTDSSTVEPPGRASRAAGSTVAESAVVPTAASAAAFAGPSTPTPHAVVAPTPADEHDERHVLAMLDAILAMFPRSSGLPLEADLTAPGPGAHREAESAADRIPLHPGDDIFPALSTLLPAYRFPIILAGLVAALLVSTVVPADYPLRPVALSLHVLSLVVSFGAVLVIDWHGLLWLAGRRGLTESTRLAAGAGPLIWGGLAGLMATGALLHPNLQSPLTVTKLVLVLAVAWNGAAMSALRRRMAQLPAYVKPADLPRRDWRLMMTATVISQVGWWGAILIGFVNSST